MAPIALISRARQALARYRRREGPAPPETAPDPLAEGRRMFDGHAAKSRDVGIDRLLFWLSFDCDTDKDAAAAERLDPWLRRLGVRASYAVPGVQLERAAETYGRLAKAGAVFLNHGYRAHAEWRGDRHHPVTFYDQMSPAEVVADIRRGHDTATRVTGTPPRGFRAPHFGSFQAPEQLALLHGEAKRLGYAYCSTTVPQFGLDHGPLVDCGIAEFPLTGSLRTPALILDSWCHLEDRANYRLADAYFDLLQETVDYMVDNRQPGLLSFYVDPAHVDGQTPFLNAVDHLRRRGVESVRPEDLLDLDRCRVAVPMRDAR